MKRSFTVRPPRPRFAFLSQASRTDGKRNCPALIDQVAFKVYDMDRDGFISNGELFLVLKMMVGSNLKVRPPPPRLPPLSDTLLSPVDQSFLFSCRTHNSSRLWTRRSWRRTRTGAFLASLLSRLLRCAD